MNFIEKMQRDCRINKAKRDLEKKRKEYTKKAIAWLNTFKWFAWETWEQAKKELNSFMNYTWDKTADTREDVMNYADDATTVWRKEFKRLKKLAKKKSTKTQKKLQALTNDNSNSASSLVLPVIWLGIGAWMLWTKLESKSVDEPEYSVIETGNGYEVREYLPYIVAEVNVKADDSWEATNKWFRILANYIFGGNITRQQIQMNSPVSDIKNMDTNESEQIEMTSPVNEIERWNDKHTIQFVMPAKYTLGSLPIPKDDRINLREIEWRTIAVLRYTGYVTENKLEEKKQELARSLLNDWKEFNPEMISAQYNPPYSFPWLRRNEVQAKLVWISL